MSLGAGRGRGSRAPARASADGAGGAKPADGPAGQPAVPPVGGAAIRAGRRQPGGLPGGRRRSRGRRRRAGPDGEIISFGDVRGTWPPPCSDPWAGRGRLHRGFMFAG